MRKTGAGQSKRGEKGRIETPRDITSGRVIDAQGNDAVFTGDCASVESSSLTGSSFCRIRCLIQRAQTLVCLNTIFSLPREEQI